MKRTQVGPLLSKNRVQDLPLTSPRKSYAEGRMHSVVEQSGTKGNMDDGEKSFPFASHYQNVYYVLKQKIPVIFAFKTNRPLSCRLESTTRRTTAGEPSSLGVCLRVPFAIALPG